MDDWMNSTQSGVYAYIGGYDIIGVKFALLIDATLPCPLQSRASYSLAILAAPHRVQVGVASIAIAIAGAPHLQQ